MGRAHCPTVQTHVQVQGHPAANSKEQLAGMAGAEAGGRGRMAACSGAPGAHAPATKEGRGVQECSRPPPAGFQDPNQEEHLIPVQGDTRSQHARHQGHRVLCAPLCLTAMPWSITDPFYRWGNPGTGRTQHAQGQKAKVAKLRTQGV